MIRRGMLVTAASILAAVLLCGCEDSLCPPVPSSEMTVVHPDGSGTFTTIQDAVDSVAEGDEIYLGEGVFRGDGNRDIDPQGRAVTIASVGGDPSLCVIDCQGDSLSPHRAFHFHSGEGASTVLRGITVTGGFADRGGAILCENASSPTITECVLTANRATYDGGAIYCAGFSSPAVIGTRISFNVSEDNRGGMTCLHGSAPSLVACEFFSNSAEIGGGLFCCNSSPTVLGSAFSHHWARFGGGAYFQWSSVRLDHCTFSDNAVRWCGGGAYCNSLSEVTFYYCTFVSNRATCGGGVSSDRGTVAALTYCTLVLNEAERGAGVECDFEGEAFLGNTLVAFSRSGSAVCCRDDESRIHVWCCDLFGNPGGDWTGCVEDLLGSGANICADPLLCGLDGRVLRLREESPCSADSSRYGRIGAWRVGCD